MKLLYIDESYDKRNFVLSGFLINDVNYRKLNEDFNKFLLKTFSINNDIELKGDSLFNGRDFFEKKYLDERVSMIEKIFDFLSKTKGTNFLLSYYENSPNIKDQQEIYLSLFKKIIDKSANIVSRLGKTNKQLLIIFDERQDLKRNKRIFETISKKKVEIVNKYKKSCVIIDYGYEGISHFSRMIQIADLLAYFFRSYKSINFDDKKQYKRYDFLRKIFEEVLVKKMYILKK